MSFCHLHVHSQYSILDSSLSIPAIASFAHAQGMPAVALTDHGNLFGAVDFYKAVKEVKVNPIIGCELSVCAGSRLEKKKGPSPVHITLLAMDGAGYKNLCTLSSKAYIEGFYYVPRIDLELLAQHTAGLICLSGCTKGPLAHAILTHDTAELDRQIQLFHGLFGDHFYFEIQRHKSSSEDIQLDGMAREPWLYRQYEEFIAQEEQIEKVLREESARRKIACVATCNCHYLKRDDWRAHEVLLNIQSGEPCLLREKDPHSDQSYVNPNPKRVTFPSHEFDMKSCEEMAQRFSDFPEALSTSIAIAEKCHVELDFKTKHYPVYNVPPSASNASEFLKDLCLKGLPHRYTEKELHKVAEQYPGQNPMDVVDKRLAFELEIIISKGLSDYFLLVWDFIHWAKQQKIPVGPGRGSVVGSIVAYLIGITELEPLRFNLLFERFINPGRMSYPDIDVDLCMDKRPEVIAYTMQKYGKENVAQIITFGTMKAKMSVRDVGRALNVPLSKVNQLAKLIPDDLNITIDEALKKDHDLKAFTEGDEEASSIISVAKILQGSIRSTGIHAAGLIICGEPVINHIPICLSKDSDIFATQYSMKPVELVGMLKIDFLGLKTLTLLQLCTDFIKTSHQIDINWCTLPLEDAETFQLLNQGRTLGVFQIEDGGMQDLARQLHLDRFEEIIALLSLYRPGPMGMIPNFIARKWGREPIEYDHPLMEPILKETYGIMVYQEQIMQIASRLANYTLGEGDVLRRAMGKKDAKEMAKQREKFVAGAVQNGIGEAIASLIFDKMEKFAEYGFNKSHSAAYGYLTYATAYFKAHYPSQWLAALMTGDQDDIEQVAKFMNEARQMRIASLPPDINESGEHFQATPQGIRFALSAIKGVGSQVVAAIVEERKRGPFSGLYDFVRRIDMKKAGKKAIELLIDGGCFDQFHWTRDESLSTLDIMYDQVHSRKKEEEQGIVDLFDADPKQVPKAFRTPKRPAHSRTKEELLFREKQLLGIFVSGHPLKMYEQALSTLACLSIPEASALADNTPFRMAFVVESVDIKVSSKNQRKFAILRISDASLESMELPIWSDLYEANQELLQENMLLWGVFAKERRDNESTISCRWFAEVKSINQAQIEESYAAYEKTKASLAISRHATAKKPKQEKPVKEKTAPTVIRMDLPAFRASHAVTLSTLLPKEPGQDLVHLCFMRGDTEVATLKLPPLSLSKTALSSIEELSCWLTTESH